MNISFNHQYLHLGEAFYIKTAPTPVSNPDLIKFNHVLAEQLGLSAVDDAEIAKVFGGNAIPSNAEPIAMAYTGHQFGHLAPQLGDGRAVLLGEVTAQDGLSYGIQLKGSGRTAFSRGGDGRAALGPVLREYLLSEAMAKLGIATTRALAAVTTGKPVMRGQLLPGGIITRVAKSFVRIGTFEYFRIREDNEAIQRLADHMIQQHYPDIAQAEDPYIALLQAVIERQAKLIAQWMCVGFIHGVMNTDNMSVVGETIDYGPCAFIDDYAHDKVFSSIDHYGRYAYKNQPSIGLWNLARLAECLLPMFADDTDAAVEIAHSVLQSYTALYQQHWLEGMRAKLGLSAIDALAVDDKELIESLFNLMDADRADFTLVFFYLSQASTEDCRRLFANSERFDQWLKQWQQRLEKESHSTEERIQTMRSVNPVYIPRNHQVESVIRAAEDEGDFSMFHALHEVLQNPYEQQAGKEHYQLPPEPHEMVHQTFCGT